MNSNPENNKNFNLDEFILVQENGKQRVALKLIQNNKNIGVMLVDCSKENTEKKIKLVDLRLLIHEQHPEIGLKFYFYIPEAGNVSRVQENDLTLSDICLNGSIYIEVENRRQFISNKTKTRMLLFMFLYLISLFGQCILRNYGINVPTPTKDVNIEDPLLQSSPFYNIASLLNVIGTSFEPEVDPMSRIILTIIRVVGLCVAGYFITFMYCWNKILETISFLFTVAQSCILQYFSVFAECWKISLSFPGNITLILALVITFTFAFLVIVKKEKP